MKKIDTIFKKTIVYESLQYGGKQKSVALLVVDLGIRWRHSLKIYKCRYFETNQNIRKLARQIHIKLLKVSFKQCNWKTNATEFYTHQFKDLSSWRWNKKIFKIIALIFCDQWLLITRFFFWLTLVETWKIFSGISENL